MSVGLLFEGIGGFGLAAERVGMEPAWCSEIDPHASRVLDHHWPHVKNLGDIHGIESPPGVDVLTGGFPCQDYSVAGTRDGLAGDRGALWWQYLRLITELRPTWVVGENVPGLLSSNDGRDFETIVGSLTECGYGVAWTVLDAQYFGVAQRRRRVFIVGHSGGEPRPEVLALGEGVFGHPAPGREAGPGVTQPVATSLKASGKYDHVGDESKLLVFNWQSGGDVRLSIKEEHTDALHAGQTPAVAFAQNQRDVPQRSALSDDETLSSRTSAKNETLIAEIQTRGRPDGLADEYDFSGVAQSLRSATTRAVSIATDRSVRRLTPLECERLQGFPDGWTDIPGNSDTQRYRQLGNAVAVPVAEWILGNIKENL